MIDRPRRTLETLILSVALAALPAVALEAQTAAATKTADQAKKQPNWDLRLGLSFLATGGNSRTRSLGFDATYDQDWRRWGLSSGATAINNSDQGTTSAERYAAFVRGKRAVSPRLAMTAGLKGERDRFAGIDLRTVTDASLEEKWVTSDRLTLSTLSGVTWTRERAIGGIVHNDLGALLSAHGELDFSSASSLTLELTYFPDFTRSRAYRLEGKAAVQAAMSSHLALRLGAGYKFNNDPPPGFGTTDTTATASLVIQLGRAKKP
ncbi:MAG TPA: DUF481 domain-containing protein [Thermoanaerobaculia bacterium]|nr:DUF481 domain-containing protein [Thermoanaerobaculia bacterium]